MTACAIVLLSAAGISEVPQNGLLNFSATWCGPCQQMKPTVNQLIREGLPVHKIDIDQRPDLARRFGVRSIPAFVLVVNGKVVERTVGYTSKSRLRSMIARIPKNTVSDDSKTASRSEPRPRRSIPVPLPKVAKASEQVDGSRFQTPVVGNDDTRNKSSRERREEPVIRANLDAASRMADELPTKSSPPAASVRIRVRAAAGTNSGSGTIISSKDGNSFVLTCGHIFRNFKPGSPIEVDLFDGDKVRTFNAKLLKHDLKADLGLISIKTGAAVGAVPVAAESSSPRIGDKVFSIGCGGGEPPSKMDIQVTALDRYLGPANIECSGTPVQGRSGGGLFNKSGDLIGVCFAADPPRQRGLYAGLNAIHAFLKQAGVQPDRRKNAAQVAQSQNSRSAKDSKTESPFSQANVQIDEKQLQQMQHTIADVRGQSSSDNRGPFPFPEPVRKSTERLQPTEKTSPMKNVDRVFGGVQGAEVICIVRPLNDPKAASRVIVINRASAKFTRYLSNEMQQQPRTTSRFVPDDTRETQRSAAKPYTPFRPVSSASVVQTAVNEPGRYRRSAASRR